MRIVKPKDFDREIGAISKVAGVFDADEQLSLDELVPGEVHGWGRTVASDWGYRIYCRCGFVTREVGSRAQAHTEIRRHIARTPQGSVLLRTFRKLGRGGSGA